MNKGMVIAEFEKNSREVHDEWRSMPRLLKPNLSKPGRIYLWEN